jgi:DNA topoisomerase VI subunit A
VRLPVSASSKLDTAKPQIAQIAEDYATLNPHLTITLKWNGRKEVDIKAAVSAWTKWLPSHPIVAHWYNLERFNRLIGAKISHDQDNNGNTLVREFVASFRGMARSAAQKNVLDRTDTSRTTLATLFNEGHNRAGVTALLLTLKAETKPVQPADLGIIGREHLERVCADAGGNIETFNYSKTTGTTDGLPWVIEAAFAYCPAADRSRLITGSNWSPGIHNPFRHLDKVLEQQRTSGYGTVAVVHLACPVLAFTDRGKSTLALPAEIEAAVTAAVKKVTARWAKQIKAEDRDTKAVVRRIERLTRLRHVSIKDAVYAALPGAYRKASDNGTLPANVRQIYYALRGVVQEKTGKLLADQYVTQTLIPNFIRDNLEETADWDVAYDDRGHLIEPHTARSVGLGTLAVRNYLADRDDPQVIDAELHEPHVETKGAAGNFGAVLYIEKEGFDPLFRSVNLRERFDIAIMSNKGMSTTAARHFVEQVCGKRGIPLFVLHDFDKAGLSIAATLSQDTRRYQFEAAINVIDLGLRMFPHNDITLGLRSMAEDHADAGKPAARRTNLKKNGATEDEIQFLLKQRVELNALTSRELIQFIERKLTAHGVKKLVPNVSLLKETYRAIVRGEHIRSYVEDAIEEAAEEADAITIPATIKNQVEEVLRKNPALRWDEAVAKIARAGLSRR